MRLNRRRSILFTGLLSLIALLLSTTSAGAAPTQPSVVGVHPAVMPYITSESSLVNQIQVACNTVYVAGSFSQVTSPSQGGAKFARQNLFAINQTTGAVTDLAPTINGQVYTIWPTTDCRYLYVGGSFNLFNGVSGRLIKYDLQTKSVVRTFDARANNAVLQVQVIGPRLIVAGRFKAIGGLASRPDLTALDPNTGTATNYIALNVHGDYGDGSSYVYHFALSPGGTSLAILGVFTAVGNQVRRQAVVLSLGATSATLYPWYVPQFNQTCHPKIKWYIRGLDWGPLGTGDLYFAATGGSGTIAPTKTLCDAVSKFHLTSNLKATPTWVNFTGNDSLYSVQASNNAVYVGGHQRWMDNPLGHDSAGPGSVARPGIAAVSPTTGKALAWNPTRSKGKGAYALLLVNGSRPGLWVGSDCSPAGTGGPSNNANSLGGEFHPCVGFLPL
jgi:hypothetical protein